MEIQQLITFVHAAQQESFSITAKQLGYSQAAITIQIQKLEEELQTQLFDRFSRKIKLTPSGKMFYTHSLKILNAISDAKASMNNEMDIKGHLTIGTTDSVCSTIFPQLIEQYHNLYPNVQITIVTESIRELESMLKKNEIDFAYLIDQEWIGNQWKKIIHTKEPVHFITSKTIQNQLPKPCTLQDLLQYPFLLTEKDASYRQILDSTLAKNDITIEPIIETKNTDLIVKCIQKNMGITFLPQFIIEQGDFEKIIIPDFQVDVYRQVIVHSDKWISLEMKTFFEFLIHNQTAP